MVPFHREEKRKDLRFAVLRITVEEGGSSRLARTGRKGREVFLFLSRKEKKGERNRGTEKAGRNMAAMEGHGKKIRTDLLEGRNATTKESAELSVPIGRRKGGGGGGVFSLEQGKKNERRTKLSERGEKGKSMVVVSASAGGEKRRGSLMLSLKGTLQGKKASHWLLYGREGGKRKRPRMSRRATRGEKERDTGLARGGRRPRHVI